MELVGVSTWAKQESLRLTASAPLAVKLVLERNKLRQMQRELPQEECLKRVQAVTRVAPETDDDEKTP